MTEWYKKSARDVEKELATNTNNGLSQEQAQNRLLQYGKNELKEGERWIFLFFFSGNESFQIIFNIEGF